jgi:sugar phosphate isomerase/epimerase
MGFASSYLLPGSTPGISLGCQTNAWPIDPADFDSLLSVLGKIREFGFAGFETGFSNLESQAEHPESGRQRIASSGLQFFGVHIFLWQYDERTHIAPAELYEKVCRTGAALGAQRLILSGAPVSTADELTLKVEGLHQAGALAKKLGLELAYHNHDKEFSNSAWEFQGLLRRTDPNLVSFLLDAGHAFQGGADVPAFLEVNHRRIVGLHLRDFRDGKQVPLGAGDLPLAQVAAVLKKTGWQGWVLAEEEREDGSKPGDRAVAPAMAALRKQFA